ncbi:MAG: S8 family serine peptidase [Candidatus Thorarchaeota archaeon]
MFLKKKVKLFVVFSFLVLNLSLFSGVAAIPTNVSTVNDLTMVEQPKIELDNRVVKVEQSQDIDEDNFQDSFKKKLVTSEPSAVFEGILALDSQITPADRLFLEKKGIEILEEYSVIYGMHIRGKAEDLLKIRDLSSLVYLEDNALGQSLMFDTTENFGVRKVWQVAQGYGYSGDSNTAIAVLDTGIDDSHTDSNFNLIYWQDFVGADYILTGDEYVTATDKGEHGTHVASIAASKGASVTTSAVELQDSGYLHLTDSYSWYYSWFYIPTAQTVTINWAWEGGGSTYVGFWSDSAGAWSGQSASDASSPGTFAYYQSTPGWYCAMYGNSVGAGGNYFSGEVIYNSGWSNPYADGSGTFTGVAPGCNIVGLKVLDDMGIGPTASLISALNWLYNNGQSFNVTVVNMSIGWPSVQSTIDTAVTNLVRDKGIVCVVSAGNDGTSSGGIYSPGSCRDAITVGAVNKASEIAYYSSNGHSSQGFFRPDVVAPGGSFATSGSSAVLQPIIAADSNDADEAWDYNSASGFPPRTDYYSNNYRGFQGTSMAAPFVAGLVQLVVDAMIQEEGSYTYSWDRAKKIKQIICMSASEVYNIEGLILGGGETFDGDGDAIDQSPGLNRNSKDYVEGWGVVSVEAAVQAVTEWFTVGTPEIMTLSGRQYGTHTAIRQVNLESHKIYQLYGDFDLSGITDADLFIMNSDPNIYGDPVIFAECIQDISVMEESTIFSVPTDDTYYLVVKWVHGVYDSTVGVEINEIVALTSHSDGDTMFSDTVLNFYVDDTDLAQLEYAIDAEPLQIFGFPFNIVMPGPDGAHSITIRAQHRVGKIAQIVFNFTVDDTSKPTRTDFSTIGIIIAAVVSLSFLMYKKKKY